MLGYASERVHQEFPPSGDDDAACLIETASMFPGLHLGSGRSLGIATIHQTIRTSFMSNISMHCKPILVQSTVDMLQTCGRHGWTNHMYLIVLRLSIAVVSPHLRQCHCNTLVAAT